jgi:hypothetical protein
MSQNREIKLTFDLNTGETQVEAVGFQGPACKKATEFLEKTLGKVTDFRRKSEWYETNLRLSGTINSNLCG